jgi:hypothetical protein
MAIETKTTQRKIISLAASTGVSSKYLNEQWQIKLGTARRSEIMGKIGRNGRPYEEVINTYIDSL